MQLDQPELDVGRENLMEGFKDRLVNFYYEYMIDLAVFFGADRGLATMDVTNMINFKSEIAKVRNEQTVFLYFFASLLVFVFR